MAEQDRSPEGRLFYLRCWDTEGTELPEKEVLYETADLYIVDAEQERAEVAAKLHEWGGHLADAEQWKVVADAEYRNWKGMKEIALLDATPGLAEWKAKANVEGDDDFLLHKQRIAASARAYVLCESAFKSYITKAKMLETFFRNQSGEYANSGASGTSPRSDLKQDIKEKSKAVAQVIATNRKKG